MPNLSLLFPFIRLFVSKTILLLIWKHINRFWQVFRIDWKWYKEQSIKSWVFFIIDRVLCHYEPPWLYCFTHGHVFPYPQTKPKWLSYSAFCSTCLSPSLCRRCYYVFRNICGRYEPYLVNKLFRKNIFLPPASQVVIVDTYNLTHNTKAIYSC